MRIRCAKCGKSVSNEVSDNTVIAAWIECIDCILKEEKLEKEQSNGTENKD